MMMMMMMTPIALFFSLPTGLLYILKRDADGEYQLIYTIQAHDKQIVSVALNNDASSLATVCRDEGKVKLWDVSQGVYICRTLTYMC
jgi:WD40 repeat protein